MRFLMFVWMAMTRICLPRLKAPGNFFPLPPPACPPIQKPGSWTSAVERAWNWSTIFAATPMHYQKLYAALKPGAYFILTDYFAQTEQEERHFRDELLRLKDRQGIADAALYHYDPPLTIPHETEALMAAGFSRVEQLGCRAATHTLKATKQGGTYAV